MLCFIVPISARADDAPTGFAKLLAEAGLVFTQDANLVEIATQPMPQFQFEKAYRHKALGLEVRYAVRPLSRIEIDFTDPHGLSPDPDSIYPMAFTSIIGVLSKRPDTPRRDLYPEEAQKNFNADWAAVTQFETGKDAATKYKHAVLVAIHKNKNGDAYSLFLFNDPKAVKKTINELINKLRFAAL
jgi:hypothetical protein